MATVTDIASRALRILRVQAANQSVRPADMATCIQALNAMMARWRANGMELGFSNVSNPSDEVHVPPEAEEAISYNLAVRLRGEYGVTLDPDTLQLAGEGLAALRRDQKAVNPLTWDRCRGYYDTRSDSYY